MPGHSGGASPLHPVRATETDSFLTDVVAIPDARLLAGVSNLVGSGTSALLGEPPVALEPLEAEEIATLAETAIGRPVPLTFVEEVAQATGGIPWLVDLVLSSALTHDSPPPENGPLSTAKAMGQLGIELDTLHQHVHELLLALAVGFDLSAQLPPSIEHDGAAIDDLVAQARAAGLVLPDGRLVPLVQQALLHTTPEYRIRSLQRALVDSVIEDGRSLVDVAENLARGGLHDLRVAGTLVRAGDDALATQPDVASTLYDEAGAAGSDGLTTAARRAQAAAAVGDLDGAARILDDLLAHENPPDVARAVDVSASVWAQRGMLDRSAEAYRWLGPSRIGASASLAAVVMIGVGDRDGAEVMLGSTPEPGSPSMLSVGIGLMGQGIHQSVQESAPEALSTLIRASDLMTAAGVVAPLPEIPAVLAALVAMNSGELTVADSIIDRALAGGQGGPAARPRLLLLRAWVAMQGDRPESAHSAINQATADARGLAARDELLLRALQVGLARRADDAPSLARAWQRAREGILRVPIDLYNLLPLGELVVSANRMRDSAWLDAPVSDAWRLLEKLGDPPLWSIPLHWSAAQSAILAERPADLAPHAAALVRASGQSHLASVLAAAGRAWIAVLSGQFQVAAVEAAARQLASVGLPWDGSRLAGHAAARTAERKDMARLLACARHLHPSTTSAGTAGDPAAAASAADVGAHSVARQDDTGLSARELEVAQLVLDGNTYEQIGEAIFISPRTVEHHVARIRRQLGATTRAELLVKLRLALEPSEAPSE